MSDASQIILQYKRVVATFSRYSKELRTGPIVTGDISGWHIPQRPSLTSPKTAYFPISVRYPFICS